MPTNWLEIHDSELSSAALMALVEAQLPPVTEAAPDFPTFGDVAPYPEPINGRWASCWLPTLHHHLRQLNDQISPDTTPLLAASPTTRLPVLGPIWQQLRGQAHQLVLFYVNRFVAYDRQRQTHLVSTLNELTRLVQAQQAEIEQLRQEINGLKK